MDDPACQALSGSARGRRRYPGAMALLLASGLACVAVAGQDAAEAPPALVDTSVAPPRDAIVHARALRAFDWQEADSVRRIVLDQDVTLTLAGRTFRARRAALWLTPSLDERGQPIDDVFVYAEDVGSAADGVASGGGAGSGVGGGAPLSIEAAALPIRVRVARGAGVRVEGDLVVQGPPGSGAGLESLLGSALHAKERAARAKQSPPPARFAPGGGGTGLGARRYRASVPMAVAGTPPAQAREGGAALAGPSLRTNAPLFARTGSVTFSAGALTIVTDPLLPTGASPMVQGFLDGDGPSVIATHGLTLLYRDAATGQTLQGSAQRGVIFLSKGGDAGAMAGGGGLGPAMPVESVRGVYLEGEVRVSDGQYTARANHVYYDFQRSRAVMLDATFWTLDQQRGVPLYVRASQIRQESTRQFEANDVIFTNSAFFEPELALGASSVTLTRREREVPAPTPTDPGATQIVQYNDVVARDVTLRVNDVPLFWWPSYRGDPEQPLIKDIRFENRSGSGGAARVRWNAMNLLGLEPVPGFSADVQTDLYFERGPALGTRLGWETLRHQGELFAYALPWDRGTDVLKSGAERRRDEEFRGILLAQDRFRISDLWTLTLEGSSISDETMVDAFFEEEGETRREYTNRALLVRQEGNAQLTLEAKGSFQDFIANEWLLQSQGYSLTKLPEAAYVRQADDVLPDTLPGVLTYFSEYRAGRYELSLDEVALNQRGFVTPEQARRILGVDDPSLSPAQVLRALGLSEEPLLRMDTRHELVGTLATGPVSWSPFVVGRATFYDRDFEGYSSQPQGNDNARLWTSVGLRASTQITRVHDAVDSRLLDIHRLRHILEPNLTLWTASTNVEASDIPVYDQLVDNLADGSAMRLGLRQVVQTKRGGPGRWHDTDLLVMNTDLVLSSDDADPQTPIGRFFDFRPEYSALGDYAAGDVAYRLTDATSITGSTIFDLDTNQQDTSTLGLLVQHDPTFTTLAEVRYINPQDSSILVLSGSYRLNEKYSVLFSPNYNMSEGEVQSVFVRVTRRFSALEFSVGVDYNNISGQTSFGFVVRPFGARGGAGVAGLGGSGAIDAYGGR